MTGITSHSDVWRWVRETSITALNTNRWNGSNDWNAQHRETGHYQDDNDLTGDSLNLVNPSNIAGWNKHGRPAYMPSEHKNMLGDNNCWYDEPNVPYISPYATCGMDALIGYRGEEQSHTDADAMSHIRGLYCQPPQIDNAHMTRWNSPPLLTQNFSPRKPNNLVNYIDASKPLRNSAYLKGLVRERPYIPNAVPYNSASEWRVDQSLTTTPGNRNVYIYGLSRYTTDKIFCAYVSRFGQVDSLKAMIDDTTGACTRVGFVQFSDVMNSVKCILAFQDCGYIASFAEQPHKCDTETNTDPGNTTLYLCNLPKTWNKHNLRSLFGRYGLLSCKVMQDGRRNGVALAQFGSRHICDDIIREFNGTSFHIGGLLMKVRYAKNDKQKERKRVAIEYCRFHRSF